MRIAEEATMRVEQVMSRHPVAVSVHARASDVEQLVTEHGICHFPVLSGDDLVGVVCLCDLGGVSSETPVSTLLRSPALTISSLATVKQADAVMRDQNVHSLVVTTGGIIVGIVTSSDLHRGTMSSLRCAACGSEQHVRPETSMGIAFCFRCLERGSEDIPDEEIAATD